MNTILKYAKVTAAALTLIAAAAGAHAAPVGQPVWINEGAIPGTPVVAPFINLPVDQLSGQYDEVLTVGLGSTFTTEAIFNAGKWFNNGASVPSFLGAPDIFGGYKLYAKFTGFGTFAPKVGGGFTFTGGGGAIEVWADPIMNTVYNVGASAAAVPSVNNLVLTSGAASITDDYLLGSASLITAAEGVTNPGLANGNFEVVFGDFALTSAPGQLPPNGDKYFIAPRPFYMILDLNGNFQSFIPVSGTSVQLLNSSANAFFQTVPEPGALALVGLALVGMGVATRRARKG